MNNIYKHPTWWHNNTTQPPEPPDMELNVRVAKLEEKINGFDKRLDLVEKDLRELIKKVDGHFMILSGMIITVAIGLAGLLAKGFHWL
jgi:hypothetical protein